MTQMVTECIFPFLRNLAAHNERPWFQEHKREYERAREAFLEIAQAQIRRIAAFDPSIAHLEAKQTVFRIYRDVRFSNDKSPYKTHFGAYIDAKGIKSMHGGYYLHLQPGGSLVAGGCWWFEPKVLRAVRNSIALRLDEFREIVENAEFKKHFPVLSDDMLKTLPKGFPKDFPYPDYLRPRNYCVWENLSDDFFLSSDWMDVTTERFRLMKPFMDFINDTVDDYI